MDEATLYQKLADIREEISALKIAHKRGFGIIQFPSYEISVEEDGLYKITLTPASQTVPFYILPVESQYPLSYINLSWTATQAVFRMSIRASTPLKIITSTLISQITTEKIEV